MATDTIDPIKLDINNLDKSDWKTYRFDEIAQNISERVDPNDTDLEVYVGLEHLDSESLHITRHGSPDDVNGTKLRFYKGDIIFGRRRAYQRKAGIATWDGFCSAHALVLRANPDVIHPDLFPFFIHSDLFMNRAVDISVGSLSPTINWGTLKHQEFSIPPLYKQKEILKPLESLNIFLEQDDKTLNQLDIALNTYIKQVINSHITETKTKKFNAKSLFQTRREDREYPENWKYELLKNVISDVQSGFAEGKRDPDGIPQLRMNNVTRDGRIDLTKIAMIPERQNIERYIIELDDVMFCNTNSEDLVGKSIIANDSLKGFTFSNHFTRLRPIKEKLLPKFLYIWLKYHFDIGVFESKCTKWVGQAAVQNETLLRLYIALPPIDEQTKACKLVNELELNIDKLKDRIKVSKLLERSIINRIF